MKSLVTLIVLGYQFIQIRGMVPFLKHLFIHDHGLHLLSHFTSAWSLWPFGNGNLQRSKRSAELECADGFFQVVIDTSYLLKIQEILTISIFIVARTPNGRGWPYLRFSVDDPLRTMCGHVWPNSKVLPSKFPFVVNFWIVLWTLIYRDTSTCCSYEWSPKGDVCNLHQLCQAKDDKDHNDFVFCRRVGKISVVSEPSCRLDRLMRSCSELKCRNWSL